MGLKQKEAMVKQPYTMVQEIPPSSTTEQQSKAWELRAATSLARLIKHGIRPRDAKDALTSAYEFFTEGFSTPDLREARTLLEELQSV